MDWRRLRILVKGLPAEGTALARDVHGEAGTWTIADWLLARIANTVRDGVWGFFEANRDPKTKSIPRPEPVPTPTTKAEPAAERAVAPRPATAAETLAVLQHAFG